MTAPTSPTTTTAGSLDVAGVSRSAAPARPTAAEAPLVSYLLGLGDDALVLAQRLGAWVTRAPQIEEDIALGNIALDLLGQARTLLTYAGEVEGTGRDEDALAFLRDERDFRNVWLVEIPNGDFAVTMARQLLFSAYQCELYAGLLASADATLAGLAAKAVKEVRYHRDHATQWVLRLGDGTPEAHVRMQAALERTWPYVDELFDHDDAAAALPGVAVDPASLRPAWSAYVEDVVGRATLAVPQPTWRSRGGRVGLHSEHLGHLLPEMQHLHRAHPGATW
ncbi:phenylacetate-CoA oxygenase subunit PaaC [Actinotalea ferrariae]|uniref:1,2-phenylacetyl-CoA epoxidase subunit PaaC n=1 Tax=Actinotalea ferrariae TaxID=1386098 RepID=UPI001C8B728B|nr:1,2-phenylacetyl-CoA epoxidase subunit PaaC [Actinotalea ferrariae]MBX9245228.1 phenylacetate-CoA oxygenase subunit PaaC [Actinotalea ferrariae]